MTEDSLELERQRSYRRCLSERVAALAPECENFLHLCSLAEGAFPSQVLNELREPRTHIRSGDLDRLITSIEAEPINKGLFFANLENLLVDYDWRFEKTSVELLYKCLRDFSSVLCLGTPTVFALLNAHRKSDLLVDQNSFYERVIPVTRDQIICADVASPEVQSLDRKFDAALVDPPWYLADYQKWLAVAVRLLKDGGQIFLPIIPPLLRETAESEISRLKGLLNTIGPTSILPFSVQYESPSFEVECLKSSNLPPLHGWRTTKIIRVRKTDASSIRMIRSHLPSQEKWSRYRFGAKTVAVKLQPDDLDDRRSELFFLSSVSRRDKRRQNITAISSRNMATATRAPSLVKRRLESLRKDISSDPPHERDSGYGGVLCLRRWRFASATLSPKSTQSKNIKS